MIIPQFGAIVPYKKLSVHLARICGVYKASISIDNNFTSTTTDVLHCLYMVLKAGVTLRSSFPQPPVEIQEYHKLQCSFIVGEATTGRCRRPVGTSGFGHWETCHIAKIRTQKLRVFFTKPCTGNIYRHKKLFTKHNSFLILQ